MDYEILLMNIARNAYEKAIHFQECIGQHLIASYVSQFDFKAKVYYGDVLECKDVINKEVDAHHVRVIGFYAGADTVVMVGNIIKWLKSTKDITVIVGGPEAYALEAEFLRATSCDYVIPGEGEVPILNLLRYVVDGIGERHNIGSLRYIDDCGEYVSTAPEKPILNLDEIPFPNVANSLNKRFRKGRTIGILTGRGCPYHCGFCFEGAASKSVRFRSIENVIEEIDEVRRANSQLECVNVYDDTFTLDKERVRKFCRYMKASGLYWSCEGHVSRLFRNPGMIYEMVDSGLIAMQIGIESGSMKVLEAYQKNTTPDMIKEVVMQCKKAGLLTLEGNYIIGGAHESKKTLRESMEHAKQLIELGRGMLELSTVYFAPYFGTPITKNPEKYGIKIDNTNKNHVIISMRDAVVSTEELSLADIVQAKQRFDKELKEKYYEEARKCTKSELIQEFSYDKSKLRINQNWRAAWGSYRYIREFTKHLSPTEQECALDKHPIRTIDGYFIDNEVFVAQDIELKGIYKDAILLADGRLNISEIGERMAMEDNVILQVYTDLNDKCLVYFSDF